MVADSSTTNINNNTTNNINTNNTLRNEPRETHETVSPSAPPLISSQNIDDDGEEDNNDDDDDDIIESEPGLNELSLGAPPPPLQPSMDPEFDNVLSGNYFIYLFI